MNLLHKSMKRCYRELKRAGYRLESYEDGVVEATLDCAGITVRKVTMTFSPAGRVIAVALWEA